MEELLKNIQISDKAIELYLRCIGQPSLSSFELYSIVPNISQEEFSNTIQILVEAGLFIPIKIKDSDLFQYDFQKNICRYAPGSKMLGSCRC